MAIWDAGELRGMVTRRSLGWPITLGVVMIVLLLAILVGWVIVNVAAAVQLPNAGLYWTVMAVGTTLLVLVLVGVVIYLLLTIKAVRLSQRQSNFIDSVTHELKSPIASLKLYLQTLNRRQVTAQQQADFHRFMLDDLERLDHLIDHLLDAARLDQEWLAEEIEPVDLAPLLKHCAETACQRYRLPSATVTLEIEPARVAARPADLEIIFRNLLDNALKYSGQQPRVEVRCGPRGQTALVRISDNGPGIPSRLQRKIFGRFVRMGNELERATPGTGLGLYIVRTLVRRLHGKVTLRSSSAQSGTTFEVELPLAERAAAKPVER
jgi:two-component system phosphate regulon sensor histidine kinase PhoR